MAGKPEAVEATNVDRLVIQVYQTRQEMGVAAARVVGEQMRALLRQQEQVRMVFASAGSQNEFLAELAALPGIDWSRVTAFHLDEYVGLSPEAPQSFVRFLHERLYDKVHPGTVHSLNGQADDPEAECRRYAALYDAAPIDIVCNGIGENGHLAFNDPPYADFADPLTVKPVQLDERSRSQQVFDGFFPSIEEVPTLALTLTIPAIMKAKQIHCIVPGANKAEAVETTLLGPVSELCPATVLRRHPAAIMYLDQDSAARWRAKRG